MLRYRRCLAVSLHDLPGDLQAPFRELEERLNTDTSDTSADPIALAASRLTDAEVRSLIERVLLLYGRLAATA